MSIRIKIEKTRSLSSQIIEDKKLDETVSENMKVNLPKTSMTKRNNLNENINIKDKFIKKEFVIEEKSYIYSDDKTIRDLLKYQLNTTIQSEKDKEDGYMDVDKNVSEKIGHSSHSKKIDDISRILNDTNKSKYKKIFKEENTNFIFKNYIEKEKSREEELREKKDLMMNKGFITENSLNIEINSSSFRHDQSSLSGDKIHRINNISSKIQKMTDQRKNNENHSTFSLYSHSTYVSFKISSSNNNNNNKEFNNKCSCFAWNK